MYLFQGGRPLMQVKNMQVFLKKLAGTRHFQNLAKPPAKWTCQVKIDSKNAANDLTSGLGLYRPEGVMKVVE